MLIEGQEGGAASEGSQRIASDILEKGNRMVWDLQTTRKGEKFPNELRARATEEWKGNARLADDKKSENSSLVVLVR